jgi:hypothetical protein
MPKGIFFKRCGPFDFYSAGGGVYVAEEQMKFASAINFCRKMSGFGPTGRNRHFTRN